MATAVIKDHASQKRRNFISKFLIYFFLIVITACMLLPFLWMLSSSFKPVSYTHLVPELLPAVCTVQLGGFVQVRVAAPLGCR